MTPHDKSSPSDLAEESAASPIRYHFPEQSSVSAGRVVAWIFLSLFILACSAYLLAPPHLRQPVKDFLQGYRGSEATVTGFLNAAVANNEPCRFLAPKANGKKITDYVVLRYEVKNVAEDVVSAVIWFRTVGGTESSETLRFRVEKGFIKQIF